MKTKISLFAAALTMSISSLAFAQTAPATTATTTTPAACTKRYGVPEVERKAKDAQADEMRRLKAEL